MRFSWRLRLFVSMLFVRMLGAAMLGGLAVSLCPVLLADVAPCWVDPIGQSQQRGQHVVALARESAMNDQQPWFLANGPEPSRSGVVDCWEQPIFVEAIVGNAIFPIGVHFRSAGPDRLLHTNDDIVDQPLGETRTAAETF